jgi:hypothetical protein
MPDEKQNAPEDDVDDEMPGGDTPPCGDIFATPDATYVTDADADVVRDQQGA